MTTPAPDPETMEALADAIGAMPESYNVFDLTDEATTWITAPVEDIAAVVAASPAMRTLLADTAQAAETRVIERVEAALAQWQTSESRFPTIRAIDEDLRATFRASEADL